MCLAGRLADRTVFFLIKDCLTNYCITRSIYYKTVHLKQIPTPLTKGE
jgi:hypothetical protein